MSTNTQTLNNGQQAITNYNLAKIFIFNNRYIQGTFTNSGYTPTEVMYAGTIMGRVTGTGKVKPCTADETDGSQIPIGILAADVIVNEGSTVTLPICVSGDVAKDQVVFFDASDTFDSVIQGRRFYDRIGGDTVGIKLVDNTEMTAYDNQ